jgi:hypothetical protein
VRKFGSFGKKIRSVIKMNYAEELETLEKLLTELYSGPTQEKRSEIGLLRLQK